MEKLTKKGGTDPENDKLFIDKTDSPFPCEGK